VKLQSKVRVGPMVFEVVEIERLLDSGIDRALWGNVCMGEGMVQVEANNSLQQRVLTLVHEIFHIILHQAGHKEMAENEGFVEAISYGIAQVILDNPWIVDLLRYGLEDAKAEGDGDG